MGFLAAAILVTRLALQGDARMDALGLLCAGLNIIMYASPLSAIVRAKNTFFLYNTIFDPSPLSMRILLIIYP